MAMAILKKMDLEHFENNVISPYSASFIVLSKRAFTNM
jgi:hypothetical protein